MHPVSNCHERLSHVFTPRPSAPTTGRVAGVAVAAPAITITAPSSPAAAVVGTSTGMQTCSAAAVVAAPTSANLAVFLTSASSSLDHQSHHHRPCHQANGNAGESARTTAATMTNQSFWPHEHAVTDCKSPSLPALSTPIPLPVPPTPSNWMVRGPSIEGSLATLCAPGAYNTHDSGASASSFNSSAGNPTLSPLLHPHNHQNNTKNNGSLCSSGVTHVSVGDADGFDGTSFPIERASGRKRTPRTIALSCRANSSNGGGGGAVHTCGNGDGDGIATPVSARIVIPRRNSAGDSNYENGDDGGGMCGRGRRPGSATLADDNGFAYGQTRGVSEVIGEEDEASYSHTDGRRAELQSTLYSSHSHNSASAATTTTRTSSPLTLSLTPATLPVSTVTLTGITTDVPDTFSTVDSTTRLMPSASSPLKASLRAVVTVDQSAATTPASTSDSVQSTTKTTAVNGNRRTCTDSGSDSNKKSSSTHEVGATTHVSTVDLSPITELAGNQLKPVESPTHFSEPLACGNAAATTNGSSYEAFSSAVFKSQNFAGAVELPSWQHYSKGSSSGSLSELENASSIGKDAEKGFYSNNKIHGSGDENETSTPGESEEGKRYAFAGQSQNNHNYSSNAVPTPVVLRAGASATNVGAATFASSLTPAAASTTVYPHNEADLFSNPCPRNPAKTREFASVIDTAQGQSGPTPLMDAWTVGPSLPTTVSAATTTASAAVNDSKEPSSSTSQCSSGSGQHHRNHRHYNHHRSGASAQPSVSPPPPPPPPHSVPVPVFSSTERHLATPNTSQGHNSGSFLSYHPNFSRSFFNRFGVLSATTTPSGAVSANNNLNGRGEGGRDAPLFPLPHCEVPSGLSLAPLPSPPPPPSHIPSPTLHAGANLTGGFAVTPIHLRATPTFSKTNSLATHPSSGGATTLGTTFSLPLPSSLHAEDCDNNNKYQQLPQHRGEHLFSRHSFFTPLSEPSDLPRHGVDKGSFASTTPSKTTVITAGTAAAAVGKEAAYAPECIVTPDERGGVETLIDGMPVIVLPPAALQPQQEGGAPMSTMAALTTTSPVVAHVHLHGRHHHNPSVHSIIRGSSAGSNGGVRNSPFAKPHPADPSTNLTTVQSRELLYTSSSSLYTSTPKTLTSTTSDPMLLSFSSANLAAPMASNGSNNTTTYGSVVPNNSSSNNRSGSGGPPMTRATSPNPAPNLSSLEGFVMKPDAETVQGLPRGKVPRMPGCSMRDWAAHVSAKEVDYRREQQQRAGSNSVLSGPSSCSSGGTVSAFSSPTSQHPPGSRAGLPRLTPQEVARHNTPDDLWIVIRNVVYDCTEFQRFHPGGEKLLLACAGRDATAVYDRFHAWVSCESFMGPYAVGIIVPPQQR